MPSKLHGCALMDFYVEKKNEELKSLCGNFFGRKGLRRGKTNFASRWGRNNRKASEANESHQALQQLMRFSEPSSLEASERRAALRRSAPGVIITDPEGGKRQSA